MDWAPVRGAYTYIVEKAPDAPVLTWQPALTTTKSKVAVNTMTSGSKYWFRVAAVGTAGQGPWSDAISKYAP
jgi:chitodextrinase